MLHSLVSLLGIDLGQVLGMLVPLGSGGTTRARFQLVALANSMWRKRTDMGNDVFLVWFLNLPINDLFKLVN